MKGYVSATVRERREAAEKALLKLAHQSAATWTRVRGDTFRGITVVETSNTIYRFEDAVFSGRARRPGPNMTPAWESPAAMAGLELIGFLIEEEGLWGLSPRWRAGAFAVICRPGAKAEEAFMLTSQTVSCTITPRAPSLPRVKIYPAPPPSVRRPAPPSMTRLRPVPERPAR